MRARTDMHQGWTNRETWQINIDINNDAQNQKHWLEKARQICADASDIRPQFRLADKLSNHYHDKIEQVEDLLQLDLLSCALSRVNWGEVAAEIITILQQG